MYKKGQTNPEEFIPLSSMGPKHALKDTNLIFLTNLYAPEHVHVV